MPIEIRELVIRATVDQEQERKTRTASSSQDLGNKAELDRMKEILKIIKEKNER